jgi:hypothetical protein
VSGTTFLAAIPFTLRGLAIRYALFGLAGWAYRRDEGRRFS